MQFNVGVVIVCAGKGKRLNVRFDKAILKLENKPLFYHTFKIFKNIKNIKEIVLVLRKKHFSLAKKLIKDKRAKFVEGGKERNDSVLNGLKALSKNTNYALIHDGARPFAAKSLIERILKELRKHPAVICATMPKDTVKLISKSYVKKTLDRNELILVQTPQGFRKDLILNAYSRLKKRNVFDDAQVLEMIGKKVKVVPGDTFNIKITYPEDIKLARFIGNEKL